jgi:uncharacterized ubiquitin-like protein YukD
VVIVDVEVVSLGRRYNFSLEEEASISVLIDELCEVTCQRENCVMEGEEGKIVLASMESGTIMDPDLTLSEYGIRNGSRLILA